MKFFYTKNIIYSFLMGAIVFLFPWEHINSNLMSADYGTNLRHLETPGWFEKKYEINNIFSYTNQDLFDFVLMKLKYVLHDSELVLKLISGFIMFIWAYFCLSRMNIFFALLFLLHPFAIDMILNTIRNSIAFSTIIVATMIPIKIISYSLLAFAPFWHITAVCGLFFVTVKDFIIERLRSKVFILAAIVFTGIIIATLPTFFNEIFFSLVPDRTQNVYLSAVKDNLVGREIDSIIILIILILIITSPREYLKKHYFIAILLVWFSIMNLMMPFANRLWAGFSPFLAYAVWDLRKEMRLLVMCFWIPYLLVSYYQWSTLFRS